ncbi:1-phosphatidylinositol phosphodiesterase [Mycena rebaudengoi]|nr:1-phosphatidylinositol phosphodiesterase [Mycena rebaudengoi]
MLSLSLALLLLVPATVLAADASYRTLSTASNPDWMMRIPDDRSLASISIPGTHESMAILGGDLTQCQENFGVSGATLTAQLNAGIRMFDIRLRVNNNNTFTVHHGLFYQQASFEDVLNHFSDFLAAHPAEAIIIRVKQECNAELGSCTDVKGQKSFIDIWDSYRDNSPAARARFWGPSVQRNSAAQTPTMGEIRSKIVLAVLNGSHGGRTEQYGLAQFSGWNDGNSQWVQDNYNVPNTAAIATKRDQVRRFLDQTNAGDQTAMYVNFCSGASLFAEPFQVAGGGGGTQGVNPFLLIYLGQGTDVHTEVHRTGMMMMDFPGGGLINKILSFNSL